MCRPQETTPSFICPLADYGTRNVPPTIHKQRRITRDRQSHVCRPAPTIAAAMAIPWTIRRLKSRRHTEPPVR